MLCCEPFCRDTHVLMSQSPFMFDGTTLKPAQALAMKSLGAMSNESGKAIVADEQMVARRSLDNVVRYLNGIGIDTIELQELTAEEGGD